MAAAEQRSTVLIPKKSSLSSHISAASYAFMLVAVGLPVWWKTTEVYRAVLPYADIKQLIQRDPVQPVHLHLITMEEEEATMRAPSLSKLLSKSSLFSFSFSARLLSPKELAILQSSEDSLEKLDSELGSGILAEAPGHIALLECPPSFFQETPHLVVGSHRTVFFSSYLPSEELVAMVNDVILGEPQMIDMSSSLLTHESHLRQPSKESPRARSVGHLDIFLTLLVPEPHMVLAEWEMEGAVQAYLQPFLDQFPLNFTLKSQVLYLTQLNIPFALKGSGPLSLGPEDLGLAVNSVSSVLGSQSSSSPALNLLVYLPPVGRAPLLIQGSPTNSFLVPRWGGVHLYNYNLETDNLKFPLRLQLDMRAVCGVWLGQLRALLGVQELAWQGGALPSRTGLRAWERDYQLRMRTLENLLDSSSTLSSLARLLSQISNIVISEEIGRVIHKAVEAVDVSYTLSQDSQVEAGYAASVDALRLSETAFFDQSLLALLYFPDDQKYAIYIPFFLPIGIPVLLSLRTLVKYFKTEFKRKED